MSRAIYFDTKRMKAEEGYRRWRYMRALEARRLDVQPRRDVAAIVIANMARRSRELAKERSGCARPLGETQKANLARRKHIPITLTRISFMETD